jgi:hypothetical protein
MRKIIGCLLALSLLIASEACAESLWAGMWHKTKADGSQVDCLDAGPNSDSGNLNDLNFSVSGPNGFSYTFTAADQGRDAFGQNLEVYREFAAPLAPGHYTFTLKDAGGVTSRVVDTHVAAQPLPLVNPATIQRQRNPDGSYQFNWAPVNGTRTYYYRLVVVLNDAAESAVFYGGRQMTTSAVTRPLLNGVSYKARVEVHDAPSFELLTNRSDSAFVTFTPQASDYQAGQPLLDSAVVYNRFASDGSLTTDVTLGLRSLDGLSAASVTGPGNFSYVFDLNADRDPVWPELYRNFPAKAAGLYTFHFTVGGGPERTAYAYLSTPVPYPAPDVSTYQAEDQGDGNVRFSWAAVEHSGALYYRVYLWDPATGQYQISSRVNTTSADLPAAGLTLPGLRWRVEVCDSSSFTTQRNRVIGPAIPLAVQPYAGKPVLSAGFSHYSNFDAQDGTDIWMETWSPAGSIAQMRLEGPDGYSRDLFTPGGYIDFLEPVTPLPGLYRFWAVDGAGKTTQRYRYQAAPQSIPPVDFRTVNVNSDGNYVILNWAAVPSDTPLWYAVEFYAAADLDGDGQLDSLNLPVPYYITGTSLWIDQAALPAVPFMFRIFAFDGSNGTTVNNYSRSVMVGYSGPGFDYASLADTDGDGYASNVDSADTNPAVNPFPYPVITNFTIAPYSASLTVPITAIDFTTAKFAAGCVTEVNNSASCSWTAQKPANYSFASAGAHTLYAFIRDASGNISAAASAQTVITLPPTLALSFAGTGTGSVSGGMACSAGGSCPPASFAPGTVVTLNPAPGSDSIFTGWSGDCAVSGLSCLVTMNGPRSVTATFTTAPAAWIPPGTAAADYYSLLASAFAAVGNGATIKTKATVFTENLVLNRTANITLLGGYNAGYLSRAGTFSVLHGKLFIQKGSLAASGLKVH